MGRPRRYVWTKRCHSYVRALIDSIGILLLVLTRLLAMHRRKWAMTGGLPSGPRLVKGGIVTLGLATRLAP